MITNIIKKGQYRDSVQLMSIASSANELEGIETASLVMGTPNNKQIIQDAGLMTPEVTDAGPNDIIISLKGEQTHIDQAIALIDELLAQKASLDVDEETTYLSLNGALKDVNANLVSISIPGEYAAHEVDKALDRDLNVFLFSDNVSIEEEIRLKKKAHEKGLLVMGPDCGTAIIANKGIGFANSVRQGSIGLVAASGTGTQEVTTLVHRLGQGVSHAIGTGSNDVKDKVQAITMRDALKVLDTDPATTVIVIVSKPPQEQALKWVVETMANCKKPIIANFLGTTTSDFQSLTQKCDHITIAETLEEAAIKAVEQVTDKTIKLEGGASKKHLQEISAQFKPEQQYIRGLFAGGTFTSEVSITLVNALDEDIYSNVHYKGIKAMDNTTISKGHSIVDLGADEFTVGRPHPMIDQTYRKKRFLQEAEDPTTAIILLDFILGFGSHEDPVGDMKEVIQQVKTKRPELAILAHVCGTELDSQDLERSEQLLRDLEVLIFPSNVKMAQAAVQLVKGE